MLNHSPRQRRTEARGCYLRVPIPAAALALRLDWKPLLNLKVSEILRWSLHRLQPMHRMLKESRSPYLMPAN